MRAVCHSDHPVHCGLTLVPKGRAPETIAATDDLPVRVDWLQHEVQQGPWLSASAQVSVSKDLAADDRWRDFGRMCVAVMQLRSMVSIRIPLGGGNHAMLNFYSPEPDAFDRLDVDAALRIARPAALAARVLLKELGPSPAPGGTGDYSRVAVALGTVMARYRVQPATAFDLLLQASHHRGIPLLRMAMDVVRNGRLPEDDLDWARRPRAARPHGNQPVAQPSIGGPERWRDRSTPTAPAPPSVGSRETADLIPLTLRTQGRSPAVRGGATPAVRSA